MRVPLWGFKLQRLSLKNNPKFDFYEIDRCEGDDLITTVIENGNREKYSFVIIASDSDLQQHLKFDLHNDYINVMSQERIKLLDSVRNIVRLK